MTKFQNTRDPIFDTRDPSHDCVVFHLPCVFLQSMCTILLTIPPPFDLSLIYNDSSHLFDALPYFSKRKRVKNYKLVQFLIMSSSTAEGAPSVDLLYKKEEEDETEHPSSERTFDMELIMMLYCNMTIKTMTKKKKYRKNALFELVAAGSSVP